MPHELQLNYSVETERLPEDLRKSFQHTTPDLALEDFLQRIERERAGRLRTLAQRWLQRMLSDFDINALLGVYPMHLLGTEQWQSLLGAEMNGHLLDVGAGSGDVTASLAPLFSATTTTERSRFMARCLRRRGFACLRVDLAEASLDAPPFDAISCLNVLDRCPHPLTLLRRVRGLLATHGVLIVALTFPLDPFYYEGGTTLAPKEALPCGETAWECGLTVFVREVLERFGFVVRAWTRTPYLSGGDARRPVYELDAAVIVAQHREVAAASTAEREH